MRSLTARTDLVATVAVILLSTFFLGACGGGRDDGSGFGDGDPVVLEILVDGVSAPVYTNGQAPQPFCPSGAFLNSRITFRMGGNVDPTSLPPDGAAAGGAIQIVDAATNAAALGTFRIDPADPNTIHFEARPPADPQRGCSAGLNQATVYTVLLPDATADPHQVLVVGGRPLVQAVSACFGVVPCPGPAPFTDVVEGSPHVVATHPPADPTAPGITLAELGGPAVITLDLDDALDPTTINPNRVFLVNTSANATTPIQVPVRVGFKQRGLPPDADVSRITVTASSPLAPGDVYEIRLAAIADLGGNALVVGPGEMRFTISDAPAMETVGLIETFDTLDNLGSVEGQIRWEGDGRVRAELPIDTIGTGEDGALTLDMSMTINTDMLLSLEGPTAPPGTLNLTTLELGDPLVPRTITFTSSTDDAPGESNHAVDFRARDMIILHTSVTLDCRGRDGRSGGVGDATMTTQVGGHGGPGGGAGGVGSPELGTDSPTGRPGEGGHVDPADEDRPGGERNLEPSSALFGGGGPGVAGAPDNANGASGGGGGTASSFSGYPAGTPPTHRFFASEDGRPQPGASAPAPGLRGPVPAAMVPPLRAAIGGSGGGAGGDRLSPLVVVRAPNPGGSGGGGGGAIKLSALGEIRLDDAASLRCHGGRGGDAHGVGVGKGGGGSGGSILVRTFGRIVLGLGVQLDAAGGAGGRFQPTPGPAGDVGQGGRGGDGVVQLEDLDTMFLSNLDAGGVVNGELLIRVFDPTGTTEGTALSKVIDTGSTSTAYLTASAIATAGDTGTVSVQVTGIAEDPANPGQPATRPTSAAGLELMRGPVDLSDVGRLDGFRFFRFEIRSSYPSPPTTGASAELPSVDELRIRYER